MSTSKPFSEQATSGEVRVEKGSPSKLIMYTTVVGGITIRAYLPPEIHPASVRGYPILKGAYGAKDVDLDTYCYTLSNCEKALLFEVEENVYLYSEDAYYCRQFSRGTTDAQLANDWRKQTWKNIQNLRQDLTNSASEIWQDTKIFGLTAALRAVGEMTALTDDMQKLIEDLLFLAFNLIRSPCAKERLLHCTAFIKYRYDKPLLTRDTVQKFMDSMHSITSWVKGFVTSETLQDGEETWDSAFVGFEEGFLTTTKVKNSKALQYLGKVTTKVMSLMLSFNIGDATQITKVIDRMSSTWEACNFIEFLGKAVCFFINKSKECWAEGSIKPMFEPDVEPVVQWYDNALSIIEDSKKLGDALAHGLDANLFFNRLTDSLCIGRTFVHLGRKNSTLDASVVTRTYTKLLSLTTEQSVREALQELRESPYSVLIMGPSGQAKSSLTMVMYHAHCSYFGLPSEDYYRYFFNPFDQYLSQYRSDKHTVIIDDIAFMNPDKSQAIDPGVAFVMQAVGNVAVSSNQADVADKGMIPLRPKLVIASTNVPHLNVSSYFTNEKAPRRRLAMNIKIELKAEYRNSQGMMSADAKRLVWDKYPNLWNITLYSLQDTDHEKGFNVNSAPKQGVRFVKVKTYTDIDEFIAFYIEELTRHKAEQGNFLAFDKKMKHVPICMTCRRSRCVCKFEDSNLQSDGRETQRWLETRDVLPRRGADYNGTLRLAAILVTTSFLYTLMCYAPWSGVGLLILLLITTEIATSYYGLRQVLSSPLLYIIIKCVVLTVLDNLDMYPRSRQLITAVIRNRSRKWWKAGFAVEYQIVVGLIAAGVSMWVGLAYLKKPSIDQQADHEGTIPKAELEEKQNVWKRDKMPLTISDFGLRSLSHVGHFQKVVDQCTLRLWRAKFSYMISEDKLKRVNGNVFRLCGQFILFHRHFLPENETPVDVMLTLPQETGSNTFHFKLDMSKLTHEGDIAIYPVDSLNRTTDFIGFFFKSMPFQGAYRGQILLRDNDGASTCLHSSEISRTSFTVDALGYTNFWRAETQHVTINGDCGGLYMIDSPLGPVIAGLHVCYHNGAPHAIAVDQAMLSRLLAKSKTRLHVSAPLRLNARNTELQMGPLHDRSPLNFIPDLAVEVYGSIVNAARPREKSKVRKTLYHDVLVRMGIKDLYGAPIMKGWEVNDKIVRPICGSRPNLDGDMLLLIGEWYGEQLSKIIDLGQVHTYDIGTAINGAVGIAYVDRLNMRTSAGHPWNKGKKEFLVPLEDGRFEFIPEIMEEIHATIENCYDGVLTNSIYTMSKKDEVRSKKKIEEKNTRGFCGGNIPAIVSQRVFFMGLARAIQNAGPPTGIAVGINAHGEDWSKLLEHMSVFPNGMDGDYKKYDTIQTAKILMACKKTITTIEKNAGWQPDDIDASEVCLEDAFFPSIKAGGDIFKIIFGVLTSGFFLTAIANSIDNNILIRWAFVIIGKDQGRSVYESLAMFEANVRIVTYGDDVIITVSESCEWFNHDAIAEFFESVGITYTSADKKDKGAVPFKDPKDLEFLKRKFVYSEDHGRFVGPLSLESIEKSLLYYIPTENLDCGIEKQHMDCLRSICAELAYHGKTTYDLYANKLASATQIIGLGINIPTYESHLGPTAAVPICMLNEQSDLGGLTTVTGRKIELELQSSEWVVESKDRGHTPQGPPNPRDGSTRKSKPTRRRTEQFCRVHKNQLNEFQFLTTLPDFVRFQSDRNIQRLFEEFRTCAHPDPSGIHDLSIQDIWEEMYERYGEIPPGYSIQLQADTIVEEVEATTMQKNTTSFIDGESVQDSAPTPFRFHPGSLTIATSSLADLGDFLKRPVRIIKKTWLEADTIGPNGSYDPWTLFLNDTKVKYKLNNFSFLSAKMHLRVVINASPFYYGAATLAYQPTGGFAAVSPFVSGVTSVNSLIPYSQLKHVWIKAQKNAPCEMELPFIYKSDFVNIQKAADVATLGILYWNIFVKLASANGVTGQGVTVQVYAWLEDVHLEGPSVGIAMQGGDEYQDAGPVSGPATAVANAAGWLEDVPFIGVYATATRIAASAVSSVARLFGFTNVPNIGPVNALKPAPFINLATASGKYPIDKLTLDPKAELGVNPAIVGSENTLDLDIRSYCKKESFYTTFDFTTTNAADDILFQMAVTPMVFASTTRTHDKAFQMTPLAQVANAFSYWRGTIHIKLQIIASPYHKGRIIIGYDPTGTSSSNMGNDVNITNAVFTQIVDIVPDGVYDLEIPYCQAIPYLGCSDLLNMGTISTTGSTFLNIPGYTNGVITIKCVTALTAPVGTSTVTTMVSVYGGDDLEFAVPREIANGAYVSMAAFQSDSEIIHVKIGASGRTNKDQNFINFGEYIPSIRTLLNRSVLNRIYFTKSADMATNTDITIQRVTKHMFPLYYGFDVNGLDAGLKDDGTTNAAVTYALMTPLNWFTPSFLAWRGSINWTFNVDTLNPCRHFRVYRIGGGNTLATNKATTTTVFAGGSLTTSGDIANVLAGSPSGVSGSVLTNQLTQAGLTVQLPMYTAYKYYPTAWQSITSDTEIDTSLNRFAVEYSMQMTNVGKYGQMLWAYCSAGTDFSLVQFQFVPVVYTRLVEAQIPFA